MAVPPAVRMDSVDRFHAVGRFKKKIVTAVFENHRHNLIVTAIKTVVKKNKQINKYINRRKKEKSKKNKEHIATAVTIKKIIIK